ncbi:IS91 family transposase [Runella zeae]|uniref:IS91 family transposase n=1 Tax=Runella zeae TaxID=94255 RepID=UPI0023547961|nr:IS91 family transposase [Runella zeae]
MQSNYEVADVLTGLGDGIEDLGLNGWQLRTLRAIHHCRTSMMGGHIDACDACGNISISYNSCRNRHCPKCQGHKREEWVQAREADLLPVPYFHVVFTLPSELNELALHRPKQVYDSLLGAAWQTLETFGKNKGLQLGMIAILHTWGQNLSLHPHLHCIVPGGGVDAKGNWHNLRADGKFLFAVKAMSKVFRAKYVGELSKKLEIDKALREELFARNWIVYAKRPFGSVKSVVEYLGRYTHKVAISNHRIQQVDEECVTFSYKDYRQNGLKKSMSLSHSEFMRRFAQHILPKRFVRIRHFGVLSSTWKRVKFKQLREYFKLKPKSTEPLKALLRRCRCCGEGNLVTIEVFGSRGPPAPYIGVCQIKSTRPVN